MIKRHFLSKDDRARLTRIARDGLEEHRVARRAHAILPLDRGWGCEKVSDALLLDDDTIRSWFEIYREGGIDAFETFDLAGGHRALNAERLAALKTWATVTLPASTHGVGQHIAATFGVSDTRSGLVKPMAATDFVWRKPELVPSHLDVDAQNAFVDRHEKLRNGLEADEAVLYGDAVHPTPQTRPAGLWMPRGADIAVPAASGRDRMNIQGVVDRETGATRMKDVLSVDPESTIALPTSVETGSAASGRAPRRAGRRGSATGTPAAFRPGGCHRARRPAGRPRRRDRAGEVPAVRASAAPAKATMVGEAWSTGAGTDAAAPALVDRRQRGLEHRHDGVGVMRHTRVRRRIRRGRPLEAGS